MLILFLASIALALFTGGTALAPESILQVILNPSSTDSMASTLIWDLRLPRIFTAALVGCGLPSAGWSSRPS
jgi:iron complex transport system permease protein